MTSVFGWTQSAAPVAIAGRSIPKHAHQGWSLFLTSKARVFHGRFTGQITVNNVDNFLIIRVQLVGAALEPMRQQNLVEQHLVKDGLADAPARTASEIGLTSAFHSNKADIIRNGKTSTFIASAPNERTSTIEVVFGGLLHEPPAPNPSAPMPVFLST